MVRICHSVDYSKKVFCWSRLVATPVEYPSQLSGVQEFAYVRRAPARVSRGELGSLEWPAATWQNQWSLKLQELKFQIRSCLHCCVGGGENECYLHACCRSNVLYLHVACTENQDDISLDLTSNKLRKQHELMGFKTSTWKMVSVGWNHQGWENELVKTVWV